MRTRSGDSSSADIELINPNTRTCPIFRNSHDSRLVRAIYQRFDVICRDDGSRPSDWGYRVKLAFMTNTDSKFFLTFADMEARSDSAAGGCNATQWNGLFPLYEGKMFQHFDHRAADVVVSSRAEKRQGQPSSISVEEKSDPCRVARPRYWIEEGLVNDRLGELKAGWFLAITKVTSPTNARTCIPGLLPLSAVADSSFTVFLTGERVTGRLAACFYANLASFCLDYVVRQKLGGVNMLAYVQKQLPVPSLDQWHQACTWEPAKSFLEWFSCRVLELTYTAWDLEAFARDCGYNEAPFRWEEARRFLLRCELDAAFFHLYGVEHDDVDYIMGTFPIVKRKDEAAHGDYRTKLQILKIYDAMRRAIDTGEPYQTLLDPPPADPSVAHPVSTRPDWAKEDA